MKLEELIEEGAYQEETFIVSAEDTARRVGSGGFDVLATPAMVAYVERLAFRMVEDRLPPSYSSVGAYVEMHHLAPTPYHGKVTVGCRVAAVQDRRIVFAIEVHDAVEKIGEGRHIRVLVESERFLKRLEAKQGV